MPLVNYESSDDDSQEGDDGSNGSKKVVEQNPNQNKDKNMESLTSDSREDTTSRLFSRLPAPKTLSTHSVTQNSSLSDMVVDKSRSGPIKISMPSLKKYAEEEESDDIEEKERKAKRFKGSTAGTGLSSILPKPKNSTKSSSLIPHSLFRPKANTSLKRAQNVSKSKAEKDLTQEKVNYFFSEDDKNVGLLPQEVPLHDMEFGPKPEPHIETNSYISSEPMQTSVTPSLDDMGYKRLIASKFGEEAPEQINIVDIDVSKHLSESKDWLKTISEEKEEEYTGVQPSSTARRKHQITYLALQAKQREVELKNEWARSRTTKTMSRAKYGF